MINFSKESFYPKPYILVEPLDQSIVASNQHYDPLLFITEFTNQLLLNATKEDYESEKIKIFFKFEEEKIFVKIDFGNYKYFYTYQLI